VLFNANRPRRMHSEVSDASAEGEPSPKMSPAHGPIAESEEEESYVGENGSGEAEKKRRRIGRADLNGNLEEAGAPL
jgi:hypothetical protein